MTTSERIISICKERKIPISRIEKACGLSNGYLARLKKGFIAEDRLKAISEYLGVPVDTLRDGGEDAPEDREYPIEMEMLISEARIAEPEDIKVATSVLHALNAKKEDQMKRLKEYMNAFGRMA